MRQFFLGLETEDLKRGVLITMERSTHGVQVIQQGHVGMLRAQLLLLCKDRSYQKALAGAIRALMEELLVHDREPISVDAFCQMTDDRRGPGNGEPPHSDWPPTDAVVAVSSLGLNYSPSAPVRPVPIVPAQL
jgi:hypothetical protein